MFCSQCGTKNPDDASFCIGCGTRLQDQIVEPSPSSAWQTVPVNQAVPESVTAEAPAGQPAGNDEETIVLEESMAPMAPAGTVEAAAAPAHAAHPLGNDEETTVLTDVMAPIAPAGTAAPAAAPAHAAHPLGNDEETTVLTDVMAPAAAAAAAARTATPSDDATTVLEVQSAPLGAAQAESAGQPSKRPNKRTIIIVAIAAVVIIAAIIIGVVVKMNMDAQATKEANEALHAVPISIVAPGYSEEATRIPVKVIGTNVDNETVDTVFFLKPDGSGIELTRGSYTASFPGGYMTADGTVCQAPQKEVPLELKGEGPGETTVNIANDTEVAYTVVPAANVTDDLINQIVGLAKEDPESSGKVEELAKRAVEKRDAVHKEQQRIEAERAAAEQAAQVQRELDEALAANPSVVQAAPSRSSAPVNLTGTVDVQQSEDMALQKMEDVCMLRLPAPVTVTGTQYGEPSYAIVILSNDFAQYAGRTVTVNTCLNVRVTASIASAKFSPIIGSQTTLVRTFEMPEGNAASFARFSQTAVDAAKALFTTAEVADGKVTKTGSAVGQFIAEGSSAAQYANGWNADAVSRATDASITGLDGNAFKLDVVFENNCDDPEHVRVHIAHVTLAFNDAGKITDIAFDVV